MLRKLLLIVLIALGLALPLMPGCVDVNGNDDEPQIEAGSGDTGIKINQ